MPDWSLDSWQQGQINQQVEYPDAAGLDSVIKELTELPPLVSVQEIIELKSQIASAAKGESFLLQGGDCAELFADCNADAISSKLRIIWQMSQLISHGLNKPVVKVGRLAGQYAKPRSSTTENINGQTLPSYRGDLINGAGLTKSERTPDPKRLLKGYSFASLTLNYIRTLIENQWAKLSDVSHWNLGFIELSPHQNHYQALVDSLLAYSNPEVSQHKLYTCHEALHLKYEQALTRLDNRAYYNLSTHMPWIGMRTAQLDSAHLEYMRGIANPVAIKIGPSTDVNHLLKICEILDPDNSPGRLTLITRFGEKNITNCLPPLLSALQKQQRLPLWCCDPMHGNTSTTSSGIKTRNFDVIMSELSQAVSIHNQMGSHLGGVHFELTGDDVTECIGGARGLTEDDLPRAYKSLVDPRLNADQALEMAMQIVQLFNK
jgi:3-deoxy-7-phosphoheptulonate synthase